VRFGTVDKPCGISSHGLLNSSEFRPTICHQAIEPRNAQIPSRRCLVVAIPRSVTCVLSIGALLRSCKRTFGCLSRLVRTKNIGIRTAVLVRLHLTGLHVVPISHNQTYPDRRSGFSRRIATNAQHLRPWFAFNDRGLAARDHLADDESRRSSALAYNGERHRVGDHRRTACYKCSGSERGLGDDELLDLVGLERRDARAACRSIAVDDTASLVATKRLRRTID
jgi:hypothetical protein